MTVEYAIEGIFISPNITQTPGCLKTGYAVEGVFVS